MKEANKRDFLQVGLIILALVAIATLFIVLYKLSAFFAWWFFAVVFLGGVEFAYAPLRGILARLRKKK